VVLDLNTTFSNIQNIVEAKKQARNPLEELSSDSESSEESSSSEEECIVVRTSCRS